MDPELAPGMAPDTLPEPPPQAPDLKAPPLVGLEVVRRALDPRSSAADIEEVVNTDVALTQRLLRVANSAYYRRSYPVKTVREAVVHLGFHELRRVAVTTAVQDFMTNGFAPGFDRHAFFVHCLSVAALSQELSDALGFEDPPVAFAAGLLHDVGKNFFDQHYPEPFGKALRWAAAEHIPLFQAERRVFGREVHEHFRDHAAMGQWALRAWGLPETFAQVAGHHHDPLGSSPDFLVQVVQGANALALHLGLGSNGSGAVADWTQELVSVRLTPERLVGAIQAGIDTAVRMGQVAGEAVDVSAVDAFCAGIQGVGDSGEGVEAEEDDLRVGHG
ncbi:MAG TPA: HDOD domain-containing protein [Candidatus Saccharimonadales bacterium]|nr:HDOD domain-containing protein [Candidatus Saccharimonadales bacterium]